MRKFYLIVLLTVLISLSFASMSKVYIGNEDGQVIIGLESTADNTDGAVGMEVRTYFRKQGIFVNGEEYGALPSKTKYRFLLAGKNRESTGVVRYERFTSYVKEGPGNSHKIERNSAISLVGGQGGYVLYH